MRAPLIRRSLLIVIWTCTAAMGINAVNNRWPRPGDPQPNEFQELSLPVKTTPYTVVLESTETTPTAVVRRNRSTTAVRSDGSTSWLLELFGPTTPVSQRLIKMAAGDIIVTDEIREWRTTVTARKANPSRTLRDPATDCLSSYAKRRIDQDEQILERATIAGYPTVKMSGPGTIRWLATGLGCAELQLQVGTKIQKPVSIRPGEPSARLFAVPIHFREVPADQMSKR